MSLALGTTFDRLQLPQPLAISAAQVSSKHQVVSSAPTFSDFAVQNFEVVSDGKTYGKKFILPILSQRKPNKNMRNAVKSRFFFVLMTFKMNTKVMFVFIPDGLDKREDWMYYLASKLPNSTQMAQKQHINPY